MQHVRRLQTAVPALAIWFDTLRDVIAPDRLGEFLAARFAGKPLWVLADPDRDAFIDDDLTVVARAKRNCGILEIGWTDAAPRAFLMGLPHRIGFSWDGWLLVDGARARRELGEISEAWRDSRVDLDNVVPAEACYPYGDGTGVVWVPPVSLDDAELLLRRL